MAIVVFSTYAGAPLAQSGPIDILQIPEDAELEEAAPLEGPQDPLPFSNNPSGQDYQSQVLSNPKISNVARAADLTGGGGNIATVVQEGRANKSSVTQSGNNNDANQSQKGEDNDLAVEQYGDGNRSEEHQEGKHNRKVKIQNGKREEVILEQVGTGRDEDEEEKENH